jgi:hypothetical protein
MELTEDRVRRLRESLQLFQCDKTTEQLGQRATDGLTVEVELGEA